MGADAVTHVLITTGSGDMGMHGLCNAKAVGQLKQAAVCNHGARCNCTEITNLQLTGTMQYEFHPIFNAWTLYRPQLSTLNIDHFTQIADEVERCAW